MLNRVLFENSRPDGVAALEIADEKPGARLFVPLKRTELEGEVVGQLAALRLTHTYGYTRQQCDRALEALYRFPLPGDAAVTGVTVRFGEVEIIAELREREQAEPAYEQAKREGRQAALATREAPDVFTLRLAGLQPDQEIVVETRYVQLARPEGQGWTLRIPLTTAPRFVRSDERAGRHAHGQPLALLRDPEHRFTLDIRFEGADAIVSDTHALAVTAAGVGQRVRLADGAVLPDRDCVLRWAPAGAAGRPALRAWLHQEDAAPQAYLLALVTPPHTPAAALIPREVILLVDHSGSMEGAKWAAADWAVKQFLRGLTPVDHFALGLFHDQTTWFQKTLSLATPEAVAQAIAFLESRRDSGGTELGVALEQALRLPRTAGGLARHLLIMTDAQVTDAGRLLGLADAEAARPDRRRISLLCVDAAPNAFLALQLAERGGGAARFLTSAPEEADITTALDEVLADWAAPVAVGLCLEANRSAIQAAGRPVTGSAVDLGDLPAGRAVWVASRVPASGPEMSLRLLTGDGQELATWQAPPAPAAQPALKALFGARRVLALEHLVHAAYDPPTLRAELARLGYDSAVVLGEAARAVYAENARLDAEASLKKLLVAEALECGVASSETAFVATRREAGKPVESTVVVANALPAGWSEEFLAPVSMGMPAPPPAPTPFPGAGVLRSMAIADPGAAGAVQYARAARASVGAQPAARHTRQVIADEASAGPISSQAEIFRDAPRFVGNRAILFDSAAVKADPLPAGVTLTGLEIAFAAAAPATLDPGLALEIYVDDLSAPRARVRLADMAQQGWRRPLNLRREAGQRVVIALQDRAGAWAAAAPELRVILRW